MAEFACPPGHDDRLDRTIAALLPDISRTRARKLIDAGSVFIRGRRCRVSSRVVRAGDRIRVEVEHTPTVAHSPLAILFDDEHLIAVDKPHGMASAPTQQASAGTALESLRLQGRNEDRPDLLSLHPVHRIDRPTSGVLVFAKTAQAAAVLSEAFRDERVDKEYRALVAGAPDAEQGTIDRPLRAERGRAIVDAAGKPAVTDWRRLEQRTDASLLALFPRSGRMHQLRAHAAAVGHPILGDRKYGGPAADRLMLHALRIAVPHPTRGDNISIISPPPAPLARTTEEEKA